MITRTFQDLKLSGLGLGCMRLPLLEGSDTKPDVDQVQKMVDLAIQKESIILIPLGVIMKATAKL